MEKKWINVLVLLVFCQSKFGPGWRGGGFTVKLGPFVGPVGLAAADC